MVSLALGTYETWSVAICIPLLRRLRRCRTEHIAPGTLRPPSVGRVLQLSTDLPTVARRTEYQRLRPPQWCRDSPAGRQLECADLTSIFVGLTIRIGEKSPSLIDVKMRAKAISKTLGSVERDIVQRVQFANDDGLDQLTDAEGPTRTLVIALMVHLIDQIPTE